jgi:hypothetical protein
MLIGVEAKHICKGGCGGWLGWNEEAKMLQCSFCGKFFGLYSRKIKWSKKLGYTIQKTELGRVYKYLMPMGNTLRKLKEMIKGVDKTQDMSYNGGR